MLKHPYPDDAYLERDPETNEKRWYSSRGMGVRYVHEDRVQEEIDKAVAAERERCAEIVRNNQVSFASDACGWALDQINDGMAANAVCVAKTG